MSTGFIFPLAGLLAFMVQRARYLREIEPDLTLTSGLPKRLYVGPLWEEHGYVFTQETGRPVDLYVVKTSGTKGEPLNPNPPKDTDGRREDSGRGWVRE